MIQKSNFLKSIIPAFGAEYVGFLQQLPFIPGSTIAARLNLSKKEFIIISAECYMALSQFIFKNKDAVDPDLRITIRRKQLLAEILKEKRI
jgi:hypothetical protein